MSCASISTNYNHSQESIYASPWRICKYIPLIKSKWAYGLGKKVYRLAVWRINHINFKSIKINTNYVTS